MCIHVYTSCFIPLFSIPSAGLSAVVGAHSVLNMRKQYPSKLCWFLAMSVMRLFEIIQEEDLERDCTNQRQMATPNK